MSPLTLPRLLAARAAAEPDRPLLRLRDAELSVGELDAESTRLAHGLAANGMTAGSLLVMLVPNRAEFVNLWFAAAKAGVVAAPVNTSFRGAGLAHAVNLTRARAVVVDSSLVGPLADVAAALTDVTSVFVIGDVEEAERRLPGLAVRPYAALREAPSTPLPPPGRPSDPAMLLFTSGTTGRSKACRLSHRYLLRHSQIFATQLGLRGDDVLYCPYPLFHIDAAVLTVLPALWIGAVAAIGERFSVSRFWDEVRAFDATVFDFMGATLTMLHKAPPSPEDRDHRVRLAWGVPMPSFAAEFTKRFGIDLVELYGSTDAGVVLYPPPVPERVAGSCGRPIGTYQIRAVDAEGFAVPPGEVGELLLRPMEPSLLSDGYFGDPEATLASRKDLWFHTGDLVRIDAVENVFFVGRHGEVIRRRGENVAAAEVEEVLCAHPGVAEVAVFGVASELTEQDVMAAVVTRAGARVTPAGLWRYCQGRMARHMVPRYIELVPALPKTPTQKVRREALAARGVGPAAWDAEYRTRR